MSDITDVEKAKVLAEVGMQTIRNAVRDGGMLICGFPSSSINWNNFETWVTMHAHSLEVSAGVLREVLLEYLKECAIKEINSYR